MRRWRMGVWNRNRAETFDWEHIATRVREQYLEAIDVTRRAPIATPVPAETVALPVGAAPVDAAELAERQAGGV